MQKNSSMEPSAEAELDGKWDARSGRFYMTGTQALVKLLLMQADSDKAQGLSTSGFVSGYRGSPLGGIDHALWRNKARLESSKVVFEPGLNEELAATMVWGSQQAQLSPQATSEGVFGMWYGKGPGVDRSMDAIKHANAAGCSKFGGVLAIAGDDHAARSSTLPHQSDHMFIAAMMPTLAPCNPQEFIELGLHGYAMSRYCGCWVGMLAVADTVESGCLVDVDPASVKRILPTQDDFALPAEGVSLRWPDEKMAQEARLQEVKVYAALAYARKNGLNKIFGASKKARFGIVSCGKAWLDTLQALDDLGLHEEQRALLGIKLLKLGMSWPLESEIVKEFSEGLEEILVIEEKRPIVEYLIKEQLYNWEGAKRPRVVGKFDERGEWSMPHGNWLLPARGELTPADAALAIHARLSALCGMGPLGEQAGSRVAFLREKREKLSTPVDAMERAPHYCSGCPHNTSTKLPEGSRAVGGIGCHYMATWIEPMTQTYSQMGGEGVGWCAASRFTDEPHMFANIGDGTFWHSGSLAIRQAIAAKSTITYKLLHNDAVAMTGGQPVEGSPGPVKMLWAISAEGPASIDVVAEEHGHWDELLREGALPPGVAIHPKSEFQAVQGRLAKSKGVSILFFDQTCATEKRRRRKRGTMAPAAKKTWINPEVCEGCGDCSKKSGCLSVEPLETPWGRKRSIDQNTCNQDLSCVDGFCPAFVVVDAALPAPKGALPASAAALINPESFQWDGSKDWNVVIAGVGGQGVVTLAQVLGVAASLAGLEATTIDQTGLAQKGGAVMSHLRLSKSKGWIKAARVPDGECDLLLAADLSTACLPEAMGKLGAARSRAVGCSEVSISSAFLRDGSLDLKQGPMMSAVSGACAQARFEPTRSAAAREFGEEACSNFILAGLAWQRGLLPIALDSILRAIEINGAAVGLNKAAFAHGRSLADPKPAQATGFKVDFPALAPLPSWGEMRERAHAWGAASAARAQESFQGHLLSAWGGCAVEPALERALRRVGAARAKLACYKDEYEVARLHAQSAQGAMAALGSSKGLSFRLAPPIWPGNPAAKGRKVEFAGWWMGPVMSALSKMSWLRSTPLDPFGWSSERAAERADCSKFEADAKELVAWAARQPQGAAAKALSDMAITGMDIKGYGHVKDAWRVKALAQRSALFSRLGI